MFGAKSRRELLIRDGIHYKVINKIGSLATATIIRGLIKSSNKWFTISPLKHRLNISFNCLKLKLRYRLLM